MFRPAAPLSICVVPICQRSLCTPRFRSFAVAKVGIKKTSQMVWNVLGMVWELIGKNYFISTFGR